MERMTGKTGESYRIPTEKIIQLPDGFGGEAIERLGRFEDVYEELLRRQEHTANELERLRRDGKTKTVHFRDLLHAKMTNAATLSLLSSYGL